MAQVRNILDQKGRNIWSVSPEEDVITALKLMSEKGIGMVMVINNSKWVGMFSERDYAKKSVINLGNLHELKIKDVMTKPKVFVNPNTSIDECMNLMTNEKVRHLPVLDQNKEEILGIISIGDVVYEIINEQKTTINDLKNYIFGNA